MIGTGFNDGWSYRRRVGPFEGLSASAPSYQPVRLPHDAMLAAGRDPGGDPAVAFYRSGAYEYEKRFEVPEGWRDRSVIVRFEGVYRDAAVFVNREPVAQRPSGYSEFAVRLDDHLQYGVENVLRVECRTGDDSRWYSGAGIYRDVTLFVADPVHVALDGLRVTTPAIEDDVAVALVATQVANDGARRATVDIVTEICGADGAVVARDQQPATIGGGDSTTVQSRLLVPSPRRWSTDSPHLYTCSSRVVRDGVDADGATATFGFRSLTVDPQRGLRINGDKVKLRGACIHHDNGVLGAATFARAEERRVEGLKAAGFNAIRSAHQPASRALLDACDRHGVLVMDEAFDMWRDAKRDHDYAMHFSAWWERDLDAMVTKDLNHPSVILYSIGNEIEEVGVTAGAMLARAMVERIRRLDPTRLVTNGVNLLLTVLGDGSLNETLGGPEQSNAVDSAAVTAKTAESFAVLDVAGYNYAETRYAADRERFPNRVIVGSETFPRMIDRNWRLVLDLDHVIGDFTWTGWDYLGEVGIGRLEYDSDPPANDRGPSLEAGYPWRTASCADIDITGHRLPISYYREIVFRLRHDPFIAVRPPVHHRARKRFATPWSWTSSVESWTWDGNEGRETTVEIYADADEVELIQDGRSLGRAPAGEPHRFVGRFEVVYVPGELTAVARRDGAEIGRTTLRTANPPVRVDLSADRADLRAGGQDIAFLSITLVDEAGTVHPGVDRQIRVTVDGPGILQGLGNAASASEDDFLAEDCATYRGRALAVVRPTSAGEITVRVEADGLPDAAIRCTAS